MLKLAYCDFIADRIKKGLENVMGDSLQPVKLTSIGKIEWDLDPEKGFMVTTAKKMTVEDFQGKKYLITVEEV